MHYSLGFLLIALLAAVLAFGGLMSPAAAIAKTLFVVFVLGAVAMLLIGRSRT